MSLTETDVDGMPTFLARTNGAAKERKPMAQAVTRHEQQAPAPLTQMSEAGAILAVIEKIALVPNLDVVKVEKMMELYERIKDRAAKAAFAAAFAEMQSELPVIDRKGKIEVREKDATGKRTGALQQSTAYALWEDINEAIKPVLKAHGFGISFRTGQAPDGRITVTGILWHREGHQEETTMVLQHDATGSKNAVQAVGSSTSYGKRYTACALLNITSRGEDDDGKAGGAKLITEEQAEKIKGLSANLDSDAMQGFLAYMGAESIETIPAEKYDNAIYALGLKKGKGAAK